MDMCRQYTQGVHTKNAQFPSRAREKNYTFAVYLDGRILIFCIDGIRGRISATLCGMRD